MPPFSSRTMRPTDWALVQHFTPAEFSEPDRMGFEFVHWLDEVRDVAGVPMPITSTVRSAAHNVKVGGAQDSAHLDAVCEAADIMPRDSHARFCILRAAILQGGVRIGLYPNGSLHFDRTEDRRPAEVCWIAVTNPARATA